MGAGAEMATIALQAYGIDDASAITSVPTASGDLVYQVAAGGRRWALRLVRADREWPRPGGVAYTDEMLLAQLHLADHLVQAGVPFSSRHRTLVGGDWASVSGRHRTAPDESYRAVLFEWVDGVPLDRPTVEIAFQMGALTAESHRAGKAAPIVGLPVRDAAERAAASVAMLRAAADDAMLAAVLEPYLCDAEDHLAGAANDNSRQRGNLLAVHGDLNFENVLWRGDELSGIVDHDAMANTTATDDLAGVVKWYSRPEGAHVRSTNAELAAAVLDGYASVAGTAEIDHAALPHYVWLVGSVNYNRVQLLLGLLARGDRERLERQVARFRAHGERLFAVTAAAVR